MLRRARFDTAARIPTGVPDCQTRIPFDDYLARNEAVDPASTRGIRNIPTIATCRQCHRPDAVSDRCGVCHAFHPDRDARVRLLP